MYTCIIFHNMILEDEGRKICTYDEDEVILEVQHLQVGREEYLERRGTL